MVPVYVQARCPQNWRLYLQQEEGYSFCYETDLTAQEQIDALGHAHVIIGEPTFTQLREAKQLRLLQMTWAGFDRYTKEPGFPKQVTLCNLSGGFGPVMSEYMVAGILALYKQLFVYRTRQKAHYWKDYGHEKTLEDATVLVLGTGDIGSSFARKVTSFGATCIGIRRNAALCPAGFARVYGLQELDALLPTADVVACCLPGSKDTHQIIHEQRLQMMKSDAVLVNVGRGTAVDTDALVKVLRTGHLFGAVLDVVDPEPLPEDHPLWDFDRVILTPHCSGSTFGHVEQTERRTFEICRENLRRLRQGEPLKNRIDLSACRRITDEEL